MMIPCSIAKAAKTKLQLLAYDAIAVPGKPVVLTVKVERQWLFLYFGIRNISIAFYVDNIKVGEAYSGEKGFARLPYIFEHPGRYIVSAALSAFSRYTADTCAACVSCYDENKPVIIVDIDHTVADSSLADFLIRSYETIMPLHNAPSILEDLSRKFEIIFVTRREEYFLKKTRKWLAMYHFPPAPVFFWDMRNDAWRAARYKTNSIRHIKQLRSNIVWGIGDKQTDMAAYRANGIRTIQITKKLSGTPTLNTNYLVSNWDEIRRLIVEAHGRASLQFDFCIHVDKHR